jgi:hypothetical protein
MQAMAETLYWTVWCNGYPYSEICSHALTEALQAMQETMAITRSSERFLPNVSSERVGLSAAQGDAEGLHEAVACKARRGCRRREICDEWICLKLRYGYDDLGL